jgi:hypothetical protein
MQTWIGTFNRMQRIRDMREKKKAKKEKKTKKKKKGSSENLFLPFRERFSCPICPHSHSQESAFTLHPIPPPTISSWVSLPPESAGCPSSTVDSLRLSSSAINHQATSKPPTAISLRIKL